MTTFDSTTLYVTRSNAYKLASSAQVRVTNTTGTRIETDQQQDMPIVVSRMTTTGFSAISNAKVEGEEFRTLIKALVKENAWLLNELSKR